jgi:hypothetical protein
MSNVLQRRHNSDNTVIMARQTLLSRSRKKPGPPATGVGTLVGVRLQPPTLKALDAWRAAQDDKPSRPEALRRLAIHGLAALAPTASSKPFDQVKAAVDRAARSRQKPR